MLEHRIYPLNNTSSTGKCIVYVMSRDQRVGYNHALIAAQRHALNSGLPLCVAFCIYEKSGHRSREHFQFMIDGLYEIEARLAELNIPFIVLIGSPYDRLSALIHHTKPAAVYVDFSPLRGPRNLHTKLAATQPVAVYEVDTHNVVPARVASQKAEVGARTLRTKIHKIITQYLVEPEQPISHTHLWPGKVISFASLSGQIQKVLNSLPESGVKISYQSGERAARAHLQSFIDGRLISYALDRNNPSLDGQSNLSPYLHFGQISSLQIALELRDISHRLGGDLHLVQSSKMPSFTETANPTQQGIDALLEELIVRKELADNFCLYLPGYDTIDSAPSWAKKSLDSHRSDPREFIYSKDQLEKAQTHDPAWNAAQRQLTSTGKMHGYMRMYWAKKVLEWSPSPEDAIRTLVYLNDFYSIDGGDPNGYAGIMWSVAGVHDRPWSTRDIFGVVRYMNYAGLKRKFNIARYEDKWTV